MAHLSGFAGTLTWDGGSIQSPAWAAAVTQWHVTYSQTLHDVTVQGALVLSSPGITQANGMNRWVARAQFLMPASFTADNQRTPGHTVTANFLCETGWGFQGTGITESYETDCPLDGPITGICVIRGSGLLAEVDP